MIINANNIGQFFRNMNIENVSSTQPARKGQRDNPNEAVSISIKNNQEVQTQETVEAPKVEIKNTTTKAFFAVTENENVVIRIVDSEGNLISQIPPEEFLKAAEFLRNNNKNLFSMEV